MSSESSNLRSYRQSALVLRTQQLGETDRIIILLTQNRGIVHAVARGVRKSSSKFGARLEPFMHVDLSLVSGKNLHTVSQVQTQHAYAAAIMQDYDSYTVASTIAELAEILAEFDAGGSLEYYSLTLGALSALAHKKHHRLDIFVAFCLRIMQLAGWGISLNRCALCSQPLEEGWFSTEHGIVCDVCFKSSRVQVSAQVSKGFRKYLEAAYAGLWKEIDSTNHILFTRQGFDLVTRYIHWHLEKPLKTLVLIDKETQ